VQQTYDQISQLKTPEQFGQGSNFLNQSGQGQLSTVNPALGYGATGAGYGQTATGAGQAYQNMATDPSQMQQWMNPYIQQSLAPQLQLLNQQQALGAQGIASKATGQGAFGGNRATLAQGLNAQNYALAGQQAIGQGYNEAFKQAQQAQQYRSDLGLRGLQTGIQGAETGLRGVQGAQQGYAGATQAGVGLGNIGAQQNQADISRIGLLNTIANQQYDLPFKRLNFMQGLMSGLPVSSSTTQGFQAGQNKALQGIGALGTLATSVPGLINAGSSITGAGKDLFRYFSDSGSGYTPQVDSPEVAQMARDFYGADSAYDPNAGWSMAKGGEVKRYAEGGIASIDRKVLNNPTDYSAQTINRGAQNNLFGDVTKLLALDTIAKQKQAMQNQQAMQQQAKPPVLAQLQQQAMMQQMPQGMPQQMAQAMPQGIDSARSNLPQQYAGGGIIAFNEGGTSKSEFSKDIDRFINWAGQKSPEPSTPQFIQDIKNYFTPRSGAHIEDESNRGVVTPEQKTESAKIPGSGVKSDIVIHPNPPKGPSAPAAPQMPPQAPRDYGAAGIDALTKRYEDMFKGSEDFKEAEKKAETNAMRNMFLSMMNPEKGASFVSGLGAAGKEAQAGLDKSLEGIQARKDKQIGQLVALGLKGQDLKTELQKLGITEDYYKAHYPVLAAQAKLYGAKASGVGSGGGGKLTSQGLKIAEEYQNYSSSPTSAPFFTQLDPKVQKGLTMPSTSESHQWAKGEFDKALKSYIGQKVNIARSLGTSSSADDIL
jgi:hypothetical protein